MAKEPDDATIHILKGIQQTLADHTKRFDSMDKRFDRLEKRLDDVSRDVRYSLGQSAETEFRQSQQEARIDELFKKLEGLLNPKEPA